MHFIPNLVRIQLTRHRSSLVHVFIPLVDNFLLIALPLSVRYYSMALKS